MARRIWKRTYRGTYKLWKHTRQRDNVPHGMLWHDDCYPSTGQCDDCRKVAAMVWRDADYFRYRDRKARNRKHFAKRRRNRQTRRNPELVRKYSGYYRYDLD